jgi:hypothetical protein
MRGNDQQLQTGMFGYVALEDRIPADHPLRGVRKVLGAVLAGMSKDFDGLYAKVRRPPRCGVPSATREQFHHKE